MGSSSGQGNSYDLSFKILLIGDSGVGKSSLLVTFISNTVEDLSPTIDMLSSSQVDLEPDYNWQDLDLVGDQDAPDIGLFLKVSLGLALFDGVDFKIKLLTIGGKRLKLTIWDTASLHKELHDLEPAVVRLTFYEEGESPTKGVSWLIDLQKVLGLHAFYEEGESITKGVIAFDILDMTFVLMSVFSWVFRDRVLSKSSLTSAIGRNEGSGRFKKNIEAGQERFRTLTSSYYRGAQGIILVYDVTRRETFTNLSDVWAKEVELYSTNQDCIKMLVGNKVDRDSERAVTREEGAALAKDCGCLFLECSAKTRENVEQCFEELTLKIQDIPSLLEEGSAIVKRNILKQKPEYQAPPSSGCCS
ncbi:hypothetical protein HHK36_011245 [Tetracentron sinense]|uniref:Uncharacterized protein n=1 Tax=Tetracentron sinense TaxID=13715 RepID=A0A834ZD45_TETSI|nr:hypothetical protein HHK36_011245 [Tetracentron sinense]